MKVYTRTGDDGTTGLFGGARVRKDDARIAAYGTVDELNSFVGVARATLGGPGDSSRSGDLEKLDQMLLRIQHELFVVGADLATPSAARPVVPRVTEGHAATMEARIDELSVELAELRHFILPGGGSLAAQLHVCRTVCRRAEREVVAVKEPLQQVTIYLNRLSDFFFVAARFSSHATGQADTIWEPDASATGSSD